MGFQKMFRILSWAQSQKILYLAQSSKGKETELDPRKCLLLHDVVKGKVKGLKRLGRRIMILKISMNWKAVKVFFESFVNIL